MNTSSDHQAIVRDYRNDLYAKAAAIVDYEWPVNSGEFYFIEEYLVNFLGIKSLRRSYPLIERRKVQALGEREFLLEKRVVTELQCDLGVIAIHEKQVYELVAPDFKEKFDFYNGMKVQKYYDEMVAKVRVSQIDPMTSSSPNVDDLKTSAVKACASWNTKMNEDSNKFRFKYLDLQTQIFHKRKRQEDEDSPPSTTVGKFPVAVLPGQYVDVVPRFSSEDLKRLPLNTVLVDPNSSVEIPPRKVVINMSTSYLTEDGDDDETVSPWSITECSDGDGDKNPTSSSSSTTTCEVSELDGDLIDSSTSCDTLFEESIAV